MGNADIGGKRRKKRKRAHLKTGVSRKQSTPNFPKNERLLPPDTLRVRIVG